MNSWTKHLSAWAAAASLAAAPLVAAASPEFMAYEGRNAIHQGQGGETKNVDGVDFWYNGDPPHRYQVLGSISDRRMKTGLYGVIRMSNINNDIAKAAKTAGGDAVILESEGEDLLGVGSYGSASVYGGRGYASGFGSSYSAPIEAHVSRYIVVKYLPDGTVDSAPPATQPGGQLPWPPLPDATPSK